MLYNLPRLAKGYQPIFLDYRVDPLPRYGYDKPPHTELARLFDQNSEAYASALRTFLGFSKHLAKIPLHQPKRSLEPCWINNWLEGLDTLALYGFVASRRTPLYVEIGSGYSTKVVRRAIADQSLATRVISIDPHPRAEIDQLCDQVIRKPLESAA